MIQINKIALTSLRQFDILKVYSRTIQVDLNRFNSIPINQRNFSRFKKGHYRNPRSIDFSDS